MNRPSQVRRTGRRRPSVLGRALAAVASAGLAGLLAAPPAAADVVRDRQWHLDALNVAEAHQITKGAGVTVAVVDSRAEITHPDLAGNVLPGKDFMSADAIRDRGHGIAVASLLAGHGHGPGNRAGVLGIAPEAKILPVRAMNDPATIAEGIRWAVDQDVTVLNLSQGVGYNSPKLENAVHYAQAHGVVIVASAGNAPQGDDEVAYPAAYPGVVAVSATARGGQIAEVSTTGPNVELAAPGEDIQVAELDGGYSVKTGTTEAAPIVAGTAALIRARYPDLDAASVINRLIHTAADQGPQGKDPKYGHGIVNPAQALTADIPPVQHNPLGSLTQPNKPTASPGAAAGPSGNDTNSGPGAALLIGIAAAALAILTAITALIARATRRKPTPAAAATRPGPPPHRPPPGQPPYGHPHTGPPPPGWQPPPGPPPGWQPPPGPPRR